MDRRLRLEWSTWSGEACLRLTGLSPAGGESWTAEDVARLVPIYPTEVVANDLLPALPPITGRYEWDADGICFVPRFGFSTGTSYTAFVRRGGGDPVALTIVRPAGNGHATTQVAELYPTAGCIPFNQLRMYLCFSAPMSEGLAGRHVRVLDDTSEEELAGAFLPMEPELWDRDRLRLTLLFDPGRIKRGLRPQRETGYPLVPGRAVRVVVDRELLDAGGRPLRAPFQRRYQVGEDLRRRVDPGRWAVIPPGAGTTRPLIIDFDRPLDHGLLQHSISVHGTEGRAVAGSAAVGREERSWAFLPAAPWREGLHRVAVDHRLEDMAGNSVSRVFDRDLTRPEDEPASREPAIIPFVVGP